MPRLDRVHVAVVAALGIMLASAPAQSHADSAGASLSGSYLAARHAGKIRDVDQAARYFAQALRSDPENPLLIERSFIHELSAGNMAKAEELAQAVVEVSAEHRISQIVLGLRAARENRHEKAREHLQKAAVTPVGELTSGLLLAWSFAQEGRLDDAIEALGALDTYDAFANFKLLHSALIADHLGDRTQAEKAYREAYESAGNSLRVVQAFGNFLERTGRSEEAVKVYDRFLTTSQRNPLVEEARAAAAKKTTPPPFVAEPLAGMSEALFSLASAMSSEQSLDTSLVYVQLALSLRDEFPVANVLLGEIYEDSQRYQRAIEAYEAIPEASPLRSSAEIQIANNLDQLERFDEALAQLDALIAERPEHYDALVARGNLLRVHEKWAEAANSYDRALEVIGTPEPQHWTVLYFRGIAHERSGQWELAEADFRAALELEPEHPSVLNYLGYSLVDQGIKLDEAMDMIRKAVELRPNDGYIVDSLGWAYYQLGDYEEAVKHLERAVTLQCGDHQCSADPVINDHLGDAYWQVGRRLEARFQWNHARDSNPEPKDLEVIKRKLADGLQAQSSPEPLKSAVDANEQ